MPTHFADDTMSKVDVEIRRPRNTVEYSANDVISNSVHNPSIITFSNLARVIGGSGVIIRARLVTNQASNTASYRLHLFHTPPKPIPDNSPYCMLYEQATMYIGAIDFGEMFTEDPINSTAAMSMRPSYDGIQTLPDLWFKTNSETKDAYGILTTLSSFPPDSHQKFFIQIAASLD